MGNCMSNDDDDFDLGPAGAVGATITNLKCNMMREQKNRNVFKYYEVIKVLGEGSMGAVSACRKRESAIGGTAYMMDREHGKYIGVFAKNKHVYNDSFAPSSEVERTYALKTIQLSRITDELIRELRNEIDILRSLDHPNIVKAFELFENKKQIHVVMEMCSGGDLHVRSPYSEQDAAKITRKIMSAIAYMHANNVCHRDLKFENVMFEHMGEDAEIKVIDFGLSKKFVPGEDMTEGVGTIYTLAPQVLQGFYTSQADLWSVGVITYMLLSNSKPFVAQTKREMFDKIKRCDYNFDGPGWAHVSEEAKDFVSALIKLDPNERLTGAQALEHKWLRNICSSSTRKIPEEFMDGIHESIISYRHTTEFKKLILMVIAHKSSTHEVSRLREAFYQFDVSHDGVITLAEFKQALVEFDFTDEELESMFESVDIDHSGTIHYTEFLAATLEVNGPIKEEKLAEAFDRIDVDDTGNITRDNLKDLLGTDYTPEKVDTLMKQADLNKDGLISFQEFLKAVRKGASSSPRWT